MFFSHFICISYTDVRIRQHITSTLVDLDSAPVIYIAALETPRLSRKQTMWEFLRHHSQCKNWTCRKETNLIS